MPSGTDDRVEAAIRALQPALEEWLDEHGRHRSNLAGAIALLHALKEKCPLEQEDVFTEGQVRRARGSTLFKILDSYRIPRFLKDGATTRTARASCARLLAAIDHGRTLAGLSERERAAVVDRLIGMVSQRVADRLARHPIRVACDPADSTVAWVEAILESARQHRSEGRLEQHLVGAKLERRHQRAVIPVHSATAGDTQTGRPGDFQLAEHVYHVTVAPTRELLEKCRENLSEGLVPVVLVPRQFVERVKVLATGQGIESRVHVLAIEDFVAQNILETAEEAGTRRLQVLHEIVEMYNRRVDEAEVDPALRITLR
jgi:hypothetical protein